MTDLINSLEALVGKVTPGPLMAQEDPCDGQDYKVLVTTAPNRTFPGTWVLRAEHNWQEAGYGERRISWKEAEANATLIVALCNALPAIIAALETVAEQFLATLSPTVSTDVNPFSGKLELVVDPRLDASSATAWYLAARPELIDTIEYAYLEGYNGPTIEVREGFEVDGTEFKARLDFGCGVLDHRGLFKNAGA